MSLPKPGSNPATFARCDDCGDRVQPGAFLCPHCRTGLQVERSVLPPEGGHGRCPECAETVWVPALAAAMEQTSTAVPESADPASTTPEAETQVLEPTTSVLQEAVEEEARPEGSPDLAEEMSSDSAADPMEQTEDPRGGRRVLGLFLGSVLAAGTAVGLIMGEVWSPPLVPWHAEFDLANLVSWAGFFGLGGALLGFLLGGHRRR